MKSLLFKDLLRAKIDADLKKNWSAFLLLIYSLGLTTMSVSITMIESAYIDLIIGKNLFFRWKVSKQTWFSWFLEDTSASYWYFVMKSFVSKILSSFAADIKSLIISALVTLRTKLEAPFLNVFGVFMAFVELFDMVQANDSWS